MYYKGGSEPGDQIMIIKVRNFGNETLFSGFRRDVDEICGLPRCYAA
jgi:hypothetical protein